MESTNGQIEKHLKTVDAIIVHQVQKLTDFTDSKIPSEIMRVLYLVKGGLLVNDTFILKIGIHHGTCSQTGCPLLPLAITIMSLISECR